MPKRELFRADPARGLEKGTDGANVDREKRTIFGASIASVGEAIGHGVELDQTFMSQVVEHGNAAKHGVKVRFGHPNMSSSAEGTFLGRATNFRLADEGSRVRADIRLADVAFSETANKAGDYVLDLAEEDPDAFGVSVVFDGERVMRLNEDGTPKKDEDGNELLPLMRVKKLWASDVVDEPATGDGLFSRTTILSATFTEQLDKLMAEESAPATIESFLARYAASRGMDLEEFKANLLPVIESVFGITTAPVGGNHAGTKPTNKNNQQQEANSGSVTVPSKLAAYENQLEMNKRRILTLSEVAI
jgi:hypothetical protein